MPRISAPTVAEHRTRQREALLSAATEVLVTEGVHAVTPARVGAAAGLARSSVYQYFDSTAALLAAVVEDAFPRANAELGAALDGLTDPADRIDAYVRTTLRLAAGGAHRPAAALVAAELPGPCRDRLDELHAEQSAPLLAAVRDAGVPNPALSAQLVGGMIRAAMDAIEHGAAERTVTRRSVELAHAALGLDQG